jgi:hypothetical protein
VTPRAARTTTVAPPDRRRVWAAEVEWRDAEDGARFVVVAYPAGSRVPAMLAESPALEWPPLDGDAIRALGDAASDLELAMVSAGWTPVAPGKAWYAKRFAWEPTDMAPTLPTAEIAALFAPRPQWPQATAGLWRCEIGWEAGWAKSRFRALAYAPGERRGREIRRSRALPWLLMAQPSPTSEEHRREVDSLAGFLIANGWEPVGTGAGWYARRFYWPDEAGSRDPPSTPDEAEPVRNRAPDAYGGSVPYSEEDLERLLQKARPTPRPGYVGELERSLHLRRRPEAQSRLRLAFAGIGLAAALAVAAVVFAVAGLLPGSAQSPRGAEARPQCRQVIVERRTRQAYFVTDRNGDIHVRYRYVLAPRPVKRCR